jgi:hypothetical protein
MRTLLVLGVFLFAVNVHAEIYKCNVNGKVEYQSSRCKDGNAMGQQITKNAKPVGEGGCRQKGAMSLTFSDVPTLTMLQIIADFSGNKLEADPAVVNSRGAFVYTCQHWESVLKDITKKHGLNAKVESGTIIVGN